MKILYAVQATGNGHISRAMELLPYLKHYGTVDIFLSGDSSHLAMDAPVKYRSKGVSLYFNSTGGLDYWKIVRGIRPLALKKEIADLPVEKYDLVINDFEYITAAACAKKRIPSVQMGHQASFQSRLTPRPGNKNAIGEWVLKNYARASHYIGLHFEQYDDFILPPVIKKDILNADPTDHGHITVYLPAYSDAELEKTFRNFHSTPFHIFSKETKEETKKGNITFFAVNKNLFNQSMIHCSGIVTGAGFETPAEVLYLGKKMICIPTRGQYEQLCNAAALEKLGVKCVKRIDDNFSFTFFQWLEKSRAVRINYSQTIPRLIDRLMTVQEQMDNQYAGELIALQY